MNTRSREASYVAPGRERRWPGIVSLFVAALNVITGTYDAGLNGGMAGWPTTTTYNAHILGGIGPRPGAVLLAGFVALVGVGLAFVQFGTSRRWLARSAIAANVASFLVVLTLALAGLDVGQ